MLMELVKCQADGFVSGFGSESLARANQGIEAARVATPAEVRHLFRSFIRGDRRYGGYAWGWVLG